MTKSTKLIYDESTGRMYVIFLIHVRRRLLTLVCIFPYRHISGFRQATPFDTREKWSDAIYVMFQLAKASDKPYWYEDDGAGWEF